MALGDEGVPKGKGLKAIRPAQTQEKDLKGGEDNAAFSVPEGAEREDLNEQACDFVFAGSYEARPLPKDRIPFGGKLDMPEQPKLSKGDYSDWEHQGYMVQPLSGGYAYPSSNTMLRRDRFELNEDDNYDPAQATPPRVKKWGDSGK